MNRFPHLLTLTALLLSTVLLTACCTRQTTPEAQGPPDKGVVAVLESINWAWGYQHTATYILADGSVLRAKYQQSDSAWTLGDDGEYSEEDIERLLAPARPTGKSVPASDLTRLVELIGPVSRGNYSRPESRAMDMGGFGTALFVYAPADRSYRKVIVKELGDWEIHNETPEADEADRIINTYAQ
jgi:hypothetical protein